jgi:hypothetical protein
MTAPGQCGPHPPLFGMNDTANNHMHRTAGLPWVGQHAIRRCSKEDQDQLAAFLALLRQQRDPEYLATLDARINDRNPQHWVSFQALKDQFRNDSAGWAVRVVALLIRPG